MKRCIVVGPLGTAAVAVAGWRLPEPVHATGTYYVAPDGPANGDGSRERPFPSAGVALEKVNGGSTLIFRPGIYRGPIQVPLSRKGTKERPTVLKSEEKWKAVVIGAEYHGVTNDDNCDWVVVDGFEVMGARYDGIKMNGDHYIVRNCYVHNNGHMGVGTHNHRDGVIERNLIEFNGTHVQFHHGVYASGVGLTIRANVVRHNAGYGFHLYSQISNSLVVNNLVYGQARKGAVIVACPEGGGKNIIAQNTLVAGTGPGARGLTIWNGDGEVVVNNIIVVTHGVPLDCSEGTKNVQVDYNLTEPGLQPAAAYRLGPHNLTGDPRFMEPDRGVFWLRPDSPAIGKGTGQQAPSMDFWGRQRAKDRPVDLGCFPFRPSLAAPDARRGWHAQYAYRYAPTEENDVPDLWAWPE